MIAIICTGTVIIPPLMEDEPSVGVGQSVDVTRGSTKVGLASHGLTPGYWTPELSAHPGLAIEILLEYKNVGKSTTSDVVLSAELPPEFTYVAGSTILGNSTHPDGGTVSDGVTEVGLNVGGYTPGANAWLIFSARVAEAERFTCGKNPFAIAGKGPDGVVVKTQVTVDKRCR